MGAFSAFAPDASRSALSAPTPGGGLDAAPESRFGFGGGASLRDSGGAES